MEHFSEEYAKLLLSKEWLVKIDNQSSTPYLVKFCASKVDLSCCVLLTDTRNVWTEVLTSKQFARRWRSCNAIEVPVYSDSEEEDAWRDSSLDLLSLLHTIGGVAEASFEVVESNFADFSFELNCEAFKWRWDSCYLGHKTSAEIISKHLIFPLISVNHLAFSSADAIGEMADKDIEKAVDKVGRTARRTVDTHIKNAVSKPRVATTLRRMTAMFNFIPDLPAVISTVEKPEFQVEVLSPKAPQRSQSPIRLRSVPPHATHEGLIPAPVESSATPKTRKGGAKAPSPAESATESEAEELANDKGKGRASPVISSTEDMGSGKKGGAVQSHRKSSLPSPSEPTRVSTAQNSDPESSPHRPTKKAKMPRLSHSDSDSEEYPKPRVTELRGRSVAEGVRQGTRQPINRGRKRF